MGWKPPFFAWSSWPSPVKPCPSPEILFQFATVISVSRCVIKLWEVQWKMVHMDFDMEGYLFCFFRGRFWIFVGGSWFSAVSLIFCFSASLLFCFFAFLLLCLHCFSAFPASLLFCFLLFLLLCFSASLLLYFCAFLLLLFYFFFSSAMCFCCSTSCYFASLLPVFTVSLFFHVLLLYSVLFVS